MSQFEEKMIREAIRLSIENVRNHGGPFGAVITRGEEIIATAVNEVLSTHDPTAHAEVQAIRKATAALGDHDLSGCEIYCSCEPCPMCLGAIYWSGIGKIVYAASRIQAEDAGFRDRFIYDELSLPPEERSIPFVSLMAGEAGAAFREWLAWEGRPQY